MIKNKAILYQGINTANSDYAAVDGELEVSQNMIAEDDGLKPIGEPQAIGFSTQEEEEKVVFIHKRAGYEHYISVKEEEVAGSGETRLSVYYYDAQGREEEAEEQGRHTIAEGIEGKFVECSAVGNILMVLTQEHLYYFLWNANQTKKEGEGTYYTQLGTALPEIDISFSSMGYFDSNGDLYEDKQACVVVDTSKIGEGTDEAALRQSVAARPMAMQMESLAYKIDKYFSEWPSADNEIAEVKADETDNAGKDYPQLFTDVCYNALNNVIAEAKAQGLMVMPRLARAAWRLYDGTYAKMTMPVLLFNTGTRHILALHGTRKISEGGSTGKAISSTLLPYSVDFLIRNNMDEIRGKWEDIIKGVTIFLGSEIYDYDQKGLVKSLRHTYSNQRTYTVDRNQDGAYTYEAGEEGYYAILPRPSEGDQLKQAKAGAPFFRAYDIEIEHVMSARGRDASARYALLQISRPIKGSSISTTIKAHTLRLAFSQMGSDARAEEVVVAIYDGDSMENIYHSVKEAIEAIGALVEVHKMYLTQRRRAEAKKLIDYSVGIAIVGKTGGVVIEGIKGGNNTLEVCGINAYGHPLPSDELPLETLESQSAVQDDYMHHAEILPAYIRAYNSRLAMANLSIWHKAYVQSHLIVPRKTGYRIEWILYYVRTAEGEAIVKTAAPNGNSLWAAELHYLYYPDSRCYKAVAGVAGEKGEVVRYLSFEMEASSGLNGAVAIEKMPYNEIVVGSKTGEDGSTSYTYSLRPHYAGELNGHQIAMAEEYVECGVCHYAGSVAEAGGICPICGATLGTEVKRGEGFSVSPKANTFVEHQRNVVLVTETENPFNWSAAGVSEIGSGRVVALCPNTMAIEQEQFGKNPLYAFTSDEGVWGLSVSDDGRLVAAQPATRDILIDKESILQIDGAILFATRRGIMMLTGRGCSLLSGALESDDTGASVPLTSLPGFDQIMEQTGIKESQLPSGGEDIRDYVEGCRMAYDYLHSRVVVYRPDKAWAWVYSLKSKQWGMMVSPGLCRSLNSYPEALCATNGGKIVDISHPTGQRPEALWQVRRSAALWASRWGVRVKGLIVTRPLKISDDYDVMKTVYKLFERGKIRSGHLRQAVWGSRDLFHWTLLGSSKREYITSIAGTPYTYFKVAIWGEMEQDEIIHRLTITYREKYNSRQRANGQRAEALCKSAR